ncbi:MAG: tryptophan--tRNA ligase [Candidatus Levybacteria bacterium]|nr:tryptophan--tRNA ligase [Candidatus Levybacteria bacterium]
MKRVYSGIRATGRLHLGNYFGAVKGMLALQDTYDCIFSVVDLHAITTPYAPSSLQNSVREIIIDFLAAGLDPKKCHLEIQSKIPQHTELAYLLSTIYPVSRLEDLPTYKDKKAQYPKYVNMGLLYYPVLMAADVLLYKGELVPVGIDQEPHLEVMREIARKFNSMFGHPSTGSGSSTFPEPQRFKTEGEYVPSLTGKGKMSKTVDGSYINLTDDLAVIKKKLAAVPTDSGTIGGDLPKEGGVASLFVMMKLFKQENEYRKFENDYKNKTIRYSELKEVLTQGVYKELKPFQEKRKTLLDNPSLVDSIIADGQKECMEMAEETMKEVRQKMGFA